jgi:hypothetical protein
VRERTTQVLEHHYSTANPDKPLWLLVPGGLLALATLAVIVTLAYRTWYTGTLPRHDGLLWILVLTPVYAGGVFVFSYGYELYDLKAALRLTAMVVLITALAVIILAALFCVLGSKGGKSSKSGGPSRGGSGSSGRGLLGGVLDVTTSGHSSSASSAGSAGPVIPPPVLAPMALACPHCGQSFFLGSRTLFCPACGGAISQDLIDAARRPGPGR